MEYLAPVAVRSLGIHQADVPPDNLNSKSQTLSDIIIDFIQATLFKTALITTGKFSTFCFARNDFVVVVVLKLFFVFYIFTANSL